MNEIKTVKEWVDVDKIIDDNPTCSWILIWGQRSNGKTYGTIERPMREGKRFAYIRRYDNEITKKEITDLISPHDIVKLTNGEYNDFEYKTGKFTYVVRDENGKTVKTAPKDFGMTFSLNTWERYKGADRGQFDYVIFDEFMSDRELTDEWECFQQMLWTLLRNRSNSRIIMLANSFTPYSLYFDELLIQDEVEKMHQGESITKVFGETKIFAYWCPPSSVTKKVTDKFFNFNKFKKKAQMAETGTWRIDNYPHCNIHYTNKPMDKGGDVIQYFYVDYKNHSMQLALIKTQHSDFFIHAHFCKTIPMNAEIVFSETLLLDFGYKRFQTTRQFEYAYRNTRLIEIWNECIIMNRVFYTTNLEGEFFHNWYDKQKYSNIL